MVGQWDQVPAAGKAPTSGWAPGQLIADEYRVPVQAGTSDGPYQVYVGMYDPATGTRLDVTSAKSRQRAAAACPDNPDTIGRFFCT